MSANWQDDDEFDTDETPKQGNDLRQVLRRYEKENKKLLQELTELRSEGRKRQITEAVTSLGLNPKVAALVPSDVEDVGSWLKDFGDIFAPATPAGSPEPEEQVDPATVAAYQQMNRTASGAEITQGTYEAQLAKLNSVGSLEELNALIQGGGLG